MSVTVKLPFPDPSLMPNRKNGRHWTATKAVKDKSRQDAYLLTCGARNGWRAPLEGSIPLSLLFVTPDGHHRDLDNMVAAAKSQIDGLAAALDVDDSRFRPVLSDWVRGEKPGALVASVGVQIITTVGVV